MFKIYDGRTSFYQWDLNQKLVVFDDSITEVHFCNKTDDCALVCEVYKDGTLNLVNVPNILLQDNWTIRAYGVAADHTEHEARFKVVSRTRPADYMYTETEIKTWDSLEERLEYLEKHGTGGTGSVLSVNGYTGEVKLTAEDVGALAKEQAATKEELKNAFVVHATYKNNNNVYSVDKTLEEVVEAYNNNCPVYCVLDDADGEFILTLTIVFGNGLAAGFTAAIGEKGFIFLMTEEVNTVSITEYVTDMPFIPTKLSELNNDAGYQTAAQVQTIVNDALGVIENGTY